MLLALSTNASRDKTLTTRTVQVRDGLARSYCQSMARLTDDERRELASTLIALAAGSEKLLHRCLDVPATESSFAAQHQALPLASAGWWREANAFRGFQEDLSLVLFSGLQHLRAAAALLRSSAEMGTPLATLTRGALEAFARARWVLCADSAEDLLWRHATLAYWDLEFPAKIAPKERLYSATRGKVDADTFRDSIKEWAAEAGLPSLRRVNLSDLVAELLEGLADDWPEEKFGRHAYSDLSGVAHGGFFAIHSYAQPKNNPGQPRTVELVAERDSVIESVAMMYLGGVSAHESIAGYFDLPLVEVERWNSAKRVAREAFGRVHPPPRESTD
jgi:hypothetical protein